MVKWNCKLMNPLEPPTLLTEPTPEDLRSLPGLDRETELRYCPIGTRFLLYHDTMAIGALDRIQTGTLLYIGPGSLEVWFDNEKGPCRVAHELAAYLIDDWRPFLTEHHYELAAGKVGLRDIIEQVDSLPPDEKEQVMAEAAAGAVKALITRWNYQIGKLRESMDGDDKAAASATRARLEKVANEARTMRIQLPQPPFDDEVFKLIFEANDRAAADRVGVEPTDTTDGEPDPTMPRQTLVGKKAKVKGPILTARDEAVSKHKAEREASGAAKTSNAKKSKTLRPCLEGCGQMVSGNFAMGHDAKLKSLLQKIERGEEPLESVPEIAQDLVSFKKGELIQEKDGTGTVKEETQTWILTKAPVKIPHRDDVVLTKRDD